MYYFFANYEEFPNANKNEGKIDLRKMCSTIKVLSKISLSSFHDANFHITRSLVISSQLFIF